MRPTKGSNVFDEFKRMERRNQTCNLEQPSDDPVQTLRPDSQGEVQRPHTKTCLLTHIYTQFEENRSFRRLYNREREMNELSFFRNCRTLTSVNALTLSRQI